MSEVPPLTSPGVPVQASWSRYVTGVDQAIERVRSEADARLQEEQQPKAQTPGTSFLEEDDGAGRKTPAAFVKEAAVEAGRIIKAKRTLIEAIDFAIGTWSRGSVKAVRSLLSSGKGPAIETPSVSRQEVVTPADHLTAVRRLDDENAQSDEIRPSGLAVAGAIYVTVACAREIMVRRSCPISAPPALTLWQCQIREPLDLVNRRFNRRRS
jgi:hypothetical protein